MAVMPAYHTATSDRLVRSVDMPGMDLADPAWTITLHERPLLKACKQLPRRSDRRVPTIDLRSHYKKAVGPLSNGDVHYSSVKSTTSSVPPKRALFQSPPSPVNVELPGEHGRDDSSSAETTILRSRVNTPTSQKDPPTPDMTPPRLENLLHPRLSGNRLPSNSSRAESFKTARENLSSDDETDDKSPSRRPSRQRWLQNAQPPRLDPWILDPTSPPQAEDSQLTPTKTIRRKLLPPETFTTFDGSWEAEGEGEEDEGGEVEEEVVVVVVSEEEKDAANALKTAPSQSATIINTGMNDTLHPLTSHPSPLPTPPYSADAGNRPTTPPSSMQRGKSLRDRVEESKMVKATDSTERFAQDIGWSHVYKSPNLQDRINSWRLSGVSTTSTVEAIVVDADSPPQRQQQLRHSRKNASLRSASSPYPGSNRNSLLSNPESPHRLVHKKGTITNQTRWSAGSEMSRENRASSALSDAAHPEIIPVAVIPERRSSLPSSSESSGRSHSTSLSISSADRHPAPSSHQAANVPLRRKRAMSLSLSTGAASEARERQRRRPPAVPPRASSLSAPTSRSNSRTNSLTSEHFRLRRLAAEEDLQRTLERMESERSAVPRHSPTWARKASTSQPTESESDIGDMVGPPSSQYATFSPPSMESGSPGPIEMGEARAINFFVHNNNSLQIVDQYHRAEFGASAAQDVQMAATSGRMEPAEPTTPTAAALPQLIIDSPLRNPREPPQPPAVKVIPPTPADLTPVEGEDGQLGFAFPRIGRKPGSISRRFSSLRRPTLGRRNGSESFVKSLGRSLSLKPPRNMKADQNLDASLHPFWRPRGFWDDITDSESETDDDGYHHGNDRDVVVSNSLGVAHQRTVIDGPISLMRHLSDSTSTRQRRTRGISKRSSHGSLSRLRAHRRMYKIPGLGLEFPIMKLRDVQVRLQLSRYRREDERRERSRQALREKIGAQVISTGDSRYLQVPPSMMREDDDMRGGGQAGVRLQ